MAHQIQIESTVVDGQASSLLLTLHANGGAGKNVTNVTIVDAYTIDFELSLKELEKVAKAFYTPLSQTYAIDKKLIPKKFTYTIEIGFLPGVTDNIGTTAKETIIDALKKKVVINDHVFTSRIYFLTGKLSLRDANAIAYSLHNPLIQRSSVQSSVQYTKKNTIDVVVPRVSLVPGSVDTVDLEVDDQMLTVLGKKGIQNQDGTYRGPLGLGLEELKNIQAYFKKKGRLPTDVEIEALAQTWSEHCKHTIFANPLDEIKDGIYKHYIKRATVEIRKKKGKNDFCVSVFSDNSGIIKFDAQTYISHKVETHNSPSALDPFGGAITGIVGVNRDCIGTGLGAKPLLNTYGYCFADPDDTTVLYRDKEQTQELLSAKRIMDGVIAGVNAGGNQSGIATPQGFVYFEKRYRGKPLVFVGTVGVLSKTIMGKPSFKKGAHNGDYIVMLGGRVGLDGIHGATFSSEALDSGSPATAVQIGDPITQKKLSDALIKEARDKGLYSSITDNGAGGLSSSVGEMAGESGGCEVQLDLVPLKYPGLSPWQIWISESQERMTLAVPKKKWLAFKKLMESRGCEATVIGHFTNSGICKVTYNRKVVMELDMDFMHKGNPIRSQKSKVTEKKLTDPKEATFKRYEKKIGTVLIDLLTSGNVGSTEFISSQYDHEVQGVSVTKPLHGKGRVNASASVSRPSTATQKGIVLSQGLCPAYSDLDTYHMAASAIDQSIRNNVAIGGNPDYLALLDNFCWCSSFEPQRLYELKKAAEACYDYATLFGTPFISGKDSMFNDFKGFDAKGNPVAISVPPTLLISSISVVDQVQHAVTLDLKNAGDIVYLLGDTENEIGGSQYISYINNKEGTDHTGTSVPKVDAKKNLALYRKYHQAVLKEAVASAVALDLGGLGIGLLKSVIGGQLGVSVDIETIGSSALSNSERLFSESNGRLLVSVHPTKQTQFEKIMKGCSITKIGQVTDDNIIVISNGKKKVASLRVTDATTAYRHKFRDY